MKRTSLGGKTFLWILSLLSAVVAAFPVGLAFFYSSEYEFFRVPIASWVVFCLSGVIALLLAVAIYSQRQVRKAEKAIDEMKKTVDETRQELIVHKGRPCEGEIPAVRGYEYLSRAEFIVLLQTLFSPPPDVQYVQVVKSLAGGYGGNSTVLTRLQQAEGTAFLPRPFVVKLGNRREMAGEHEKFHTYVSPALAHAPDVFRYAEWQDLAGIAYKFAGLELNAEIQSFHQFYAGYATVEAAGLIDSIYSHLGEAWYRAGQGEPADLHHEYVLLSKKRQQIVEAVGRIVDEDDPYHVNFAAAEGELRPKLKPRFCPDPSLSWYDPIAFLRTWPTQGSAVPIHRSTVHGDLNARNVLIEIAEDGQKQIWFIDFSHTGNGLSAERLREAEDDGLAIDSQRGHTLRDFCRLEADVKFILTQLHNENDLRLAVAFETQLLNQLSDLAGFTETPVIEALADERFKKAWHVIREIRCQASEYLIREDDPRPYYWGLLHVTLPIVYYHPDQFESKTSELQQKRYALLAAGMLCDRL